MRQNIDDLLKAVRSLLSDVESMQCKPNPLIDDLWGDNPGNWFGPFSETRSFTDEDGGDIAWPNLAISLEDVKKALKELEEFTS